MTPLVVFVCEHGAAKSVVAAAWLRRLASDAGVDLRAVACGTDPDAELSTAAVDGLRRDGIAPDEPAPQLMDAAGIQAAWRVIVFGSEVRAAALAGVPFETWDVPAVSDGYEAARDVIVERLSAVVRDAATRGR
jgi:protein-tyrosine-phosphatase